MQVADVFLAGGKSAFRQISVSSGRGVERTSYHISIEARNTFPLFSLLERPGVLADGVDGIFILISEPRGGLKMHRALRFKSHSHTLYQNGIRTDTWFGSHVSKLQT